MPAEASSPDLGTYLRAVFGASAFRPVGRVTRVVGLVVEAAGPRANIGDLCSIHPLGPGEPVLAEVVGFREREVLLMPLGELAGIGPGSLVAALNRRLAVEVGPELLGRVLDGLGRPLDGKGPLGGTHSYPVSASPPHPLERRRITEPLPVGVRAIDALLTCGKGQRLGIFSGSGVGKSTLLGMIARYTAAAVNCIALVGERGREVREFLERDLGPEGLARSVVVVATSDQPPLVRVKAALVATAAAEYFRDQGLDVLLMMDSLTRFALAQREIGLAAGEPPTTRGYTPSVFALLPRLLERAGPGKTGTITGIYTVLVEGDDLTEPVADAARSILDGHVVLSRELARRGHYPAVDVLESVSRIMVEVTPPAQQQAAARLRSLLAAHREAQDLVNVGAYVRGTSPRIDEALARMDAIEAFLRQGVGEPATYQEAADQLQQVVGGPAAQEAVA